ncbi:MAG: DUF4197 domain-containing protein [Betaproteobacteria bacterium]
MIVAGPAVAGLESISSQDAASGLREALVTGTQFAVDSLGKTDGFFGNGKVKIPLPESAQKIEKVLRQFGMGRQADELILAINRAAEAAVPEARTLLVDSVRKMSVQDAKAILTGGQDSATQYFKRNTSDQLRAKFLPIVKKATARVSLAQKYDEYAGKGVQLGLVKKEDANLDSYVTQKALDGLFVMVAEQEARIRHNPAEAASGILRKVFGAMK